MEITENIRKTLLEYQKSEATGAEIYRRISGIVKDENDKATLLKIAREEDRHAAIWKRYTKTSIGYNRWHVLFYTLLAKLFGYTFAIKLMEKGENATIDNYTRDPEFIKAVPESARITEEEEAHEDALIDMLDEEKLKYMGSIVLGLNDALVEISGSLAGFTFAMGSNKLISMAGLITGISATLSMASSEYLSNRSEGSSNPLKSSIYTGFAYLIAVVLMIMPFLLLPDQMHYQALFLTMIIVVGIIFVFNFYLSVAKDYNFKTRFLEMAAISLGVATLSFLIGIAVKNFLGVEL